MRTFLAPFVLVALTVGSFAGEIRHGATMQVKPNSIWFQDTAKLTHWQQLKKIGDSAALASYQDEVLSQRKAWQCTKQLTVRILSYERGKNQVNVEMKTAGRMLGSTWVLDADTLVQ
jgi:murein L,D-transpeptidase YcbB/YkuD